jgi:hypothetical protein
VVERLADLPGRATDPCAQLLFQFRAITTVSSLSRRSGVAIVAGSSTTAKARATGLSVHPYYRGLGDARVPTHRVFDFPRAEPVAGHVDDIVGAAQDEVVAIFVANATVEGCMVEAARKMVKDFPRPPLEDITVPGGAAEVASSYS